MERILPEPQQHPGPKCALGCRGLPAASTLPTDGSARILHMCRLVPNLRSKTTSQTQSVARSQETEADATRERAEVKAQLW